MAGSKKQTGRASALPGGIAIGVLAALVITVLGAVLLTTLIAGEHLALDVYGYGVMMILFLAALAGAVTAMLRIKHMKMQVSLLTGAAYYLVLLATNALFFGGQYEGALTTGLIILAASGVAAVIGSREGKPVKRRRKIPAYR